MTLLTQDYHHLQARELVAKALLDSITNTTARPQLTQRDITVQTGTDWLTVHKSLMSLQDEGVIRIERNRMIVNKELLQKIAGTTSVPSIRV